jgi:hypothetical protein
LQSKGHVRQFSIYSGSQSPFPHWAVKCNEKERRGEKERREWKERMRKRRGRENIENIRMQPVYPSP